MLRCAMTDIRRSADHHNVMAAIGKPKPTKQKKTKRPPINKRAILAKRYGESVVYPCECGCGGYGQDLHHCFIHDNKYIPVLSDERNLVLVNHHEHTALKKFNNREWRIRFWKIQCDRYGEKAMLEWVEQIPPKMRSRIDWL